MNRKVYAGLAFIVCLLTVVGQAGISVVAATPLPDAEIKALSDYPNWVADACSSTSTDTVAGTDAGSANNGVSFTTQMTIDDDGIGPSHGDPNHQSHTSYADGKLNADVTSYIALAPGWAQNHGLVLGDVAAVKHNGKTAFAVYGDNYAGDQIHGEGSVHLSLALGGTASDTIPSPVDYTVFPGSHTQLAGSVDQAKIDQIGQQLSGATPSPADTNSSCCDGIGGPAGSGPLFGITFPQVSDTNELANHINKVISDIQPSSPLKTLGTSFVSAGQKYNVNPALEVAIAYKESSLGINQVANSHDAWGLTAVGDVSGYPYVGGEYAFPSWEVGIEQATKYVGDNYTKQGAPLYSTTVLEFMKHYTPPNYVAQTKITLDFMHKILDGISTSAGASATADGTLGNASTLDSCSGATNNAAGANGWNLGNGPNSMVYFGQCDPKWADQPYGNPGQASICASGCGITSLAMVIDTLKNKQETPLTLAKKYGAKYHTVGTDWSLWPVAASDYNLKMQDLGTDLNRTRDTITAGGLVIISVNPGAFTSEGHFMVIRAIDDKGNFYLADPNNAGNKAAGRGDTNNTPYSADFLRTKGSLLHLWAWMP